MIMDWFNRLLTVDAPPGTRLRAAEWGLRGPLPAWSAALLFLALVIGCVWLYARESAQLGWGRRALLAALRASALGLLLGLSLRPVLMAEFAGERPRPVVVLLDNSQSLRQQDRRVTARDRWRVAVAQGQVSPDSSPDGPEWSS